jgi:serine protease Do
MDNLLAVSPALPSGTSGSPLVNQTGQVVGITLSLDPMVGNNQNLTFAVPIDEAMLVTKQVLAHQQVVHPWLGVADATDVPASVSSSLGIDGGVTAGSVASGSPASKAGIKSSDIIYRFNSQDVPSAGGLTALVDQCQPNLVTTISFIHDSKHITRTIVVTNEPNDP